MKFTDEHFRGAVHAVTSGLAATCALYNLMRLSEPTCKAKRRHVINVVVYGSLWLYEIHQTHLHWTTACKKDA